MTSPLQYDTAFALQTIRAAAQKNNATQTALPLDMYIGAGVTGAQSAFLSAYNSALDSAAVTGARADTTAEVQAIVNAYNRILTLTDGYGGSPIPVISTAEFTAIGVTGVSGSSDRGSEVHLLNDSLFGVGRAAADTVAEVQVRANAAKHVIAATGGNVFQSANLTVQDFSALNITGVTADNLDTIRTVLRAVRSDLEVDTRYSLQFMVNAILGTSAESAMGVISAEAFYNTANATTLTTKVYANTGVTGVDSSNLASINSAINSDAIDGFVAYRTLQTIVDSYNAILRSADGMAGNTAKALTGAQYSAVGVTGISATATPTDGSALHLLDSVVDASRKAQVDTVPELQALANASSRVMDAAGGSAAQAAALTLKDLSTLGITGVYAPNMAAVRMAIEASSSDNALDTQTGLQGVVNAALAPIAAGDTAARALSAIRYAAQYNTASDSQPSLAVYTAAGVTGGQGANLSAYNSALDSTAVDGAAVYTTAKVQALVNAYNTILLSTDSYMGQPIPQASAAEFAKVGVTGVTGVSSDYSSALHLMDDSLFGAGRAAADTVAELQARANAANHVIAAAGGTAAEAAALTVQDMAALGITGVTDANITAVRTVLHAVSTDTTISSKYNLQYLVDATVTSNANSALTWISTEAYHHGANDVTVSAAMYAHAGVQGVDSNNVSAINSAINRQSSHDLVTYSVQGLQPIVDTYSAILKSADGVAGNTATPLTAAQWAVVGVNVKEVADTFSLDHNLHLLNSVVDASAKAQVDTVPELQAIADAAHHVMSWVGSLDVGGLPPTSPPVPLTVQDLQTLGITGSYADHMAAINTALQYTGGVLRTALDTQSELQSFVDYTVANGHGPAIPYPLDDQKIQVVTAVDPVVMTGIQHIVATAVDPVVATAIEAVPVDPFFTGSCIDLRFTVCLFNTAAQVTDIATLVNPPVLAA